MIEMIYFIFNDLMPFKYVKIWNAPMVQTGYTECKIYSSFYAPVHQTGPTES